MAVSNKVTGWGENLYLESVIHQQLDIDRLHIEFGQPQDKNDNTLNRNQLKEKGTPKFCN
jgi:hypothetical protein